MISFEEALECALGELNEAWTEWKDACGKLHRNQYSERRMADANAAHQRFIVAHGKYLALAKLIGKRLEHVLRESADIG